MPENTKNMQKCSVGVWGKKSQSDFPLSNGNLCSEKRRIYGRLTRTVIFFRRTFKSKLCHSNRVRCVAQCLGCMSVAAAFVSTRVYMHSLPLYAHSARTQRTHTQNRMKCQRHRMRREREKVLPQRQATAHSTY